MAQASTIPRYGSKLYETLNKCINEEIIELNQFFKNQEKIIKLTK